MSVQLYPLTSMQASMALASIRAPRSGTYVVQEVCESEEDWNLDLLKQSWRRVAGRHEALRTSIVTGAEDALWQRVLDNPDVAWQALDWTGATPEQVQERLAAFLRDDRERGFDFDDGVPMRFTLLRSRRSSTLIWTSHHVLLDGRSYLIVWREWLDVYDALRQGKEVPLPAAKPFRDHIHWLQSQDWTRAEHYWRKSLAGLSETTNYVVDRIGRSSPPPREGFAKESARLAEQLTQELWSFARQHAVSVNNLVQGAWALLLKRYSGRADVVFGVTRAGRNSSVADAQDIVGVFINTLPFRIEVQGDCGLLPWLKQIRRQWVDLRDFEHTPLDKVWAWSGLPRGMPPFDSLVVYDREPPPETWRNFGSQYQHRAYRRLQHTDAALTLAAYGSPVLTLEIIYDTRLFGSRTVRRMLGHLETLLASFVAQPDSGLAALPMLTEPERRWLIQERNQTEAPYPRDLCAHRLFEQQVRRTPEKAALEYSGGSISYDQMNRQANQLAWFLKEKGAGPEDLIALCMHRSPQAVIAALAALKAGAAFLPLHAGLPPARLVWMLQNARPKFVIATEASAPKLASGECEVLSLERMEKECAGQPTENLPDAAKPANAAYAIYTSGSTGEPKAVVISHLTLVNHTVAACRVFGISEADRRLAFASIGTDVFVAEVFNYLCSGATLVDCLNPEGNSVAEFLRLLEERRVTITGIPSTWWSEWVLALCEGGLTLPPSLRAVIAGMESVNPAVFAEWKRVVGDNVRWFNAYGPTETGLTTTIYEAGSSEWEGASFVPIGKPIANAKVYVLDGERNPVPVGVPGELYISGDGVGIGYLNAPELTARKFLPDPFSGNPDSRLYRTGDLVFSLPDGNLVFLGRLDRQVKIRGFRVELEEIEAVLAQDPAVRQCAVLLDGSQGQESLVAYLSPNRSESPDSDQLRRRLSQRLPDHMIPSAFVILPELPRTSSGKIDRQSLPPYEPQRLSSGNAFHEPTTPTEMRLAALWQEALGVARIGTTDNFFELAGNSLRATRLITLVRKHLGQELPLALLLRAPTIAQLALELDGEGRAPALLTPIQPKGDKTPLFCAAGHDGDLLGYSNLAGHLSPDQPVLAFSPPEFHEYEQGFQLQGPAQRSIDAMRARQPEGPYLLAGVCFGGCLVYEIAQLLQERGQEVALLVLIDCPYRGWIRNLPAHSVLAHKVRHLVRRTVYHFRGFTQRGGGLKYLRERSRMVAGYRQEQIGQRAVERCLRDGKPWPADLRETRFANWAAAKNWVPQPYFGNVLLVGSSDPRAGVYPAPLMGWQGLLLGEVESREAPDNLRGLLAEPAVRLVAECVETALALARHAAQPAQSSRLT